MLRCAQLYIWDYVFGVVVCLLWGFFLFEYIGYFGLVFGVFAVVDVGLVVGVSVFVVLDCCVGFVLFALVSWSVV